MKTPPPLPQKKSTGPRTKVKVLVGLLLLVGVASVLLVASGGLRLFNTESDSMAPVLDKGDHFLLTRFVREYHRGDVVGFSAPRLGDPSTSEQYVKRIVGLPGETLRIEDGALVVNGIRTPLRNHAGEIAYVPTFAGNFLTKPGDSVVVPAGCYFLMGDNSARSYDSRFYGCISADKVFGRAFWCFALPPRGGAIH